MNSGFAVCKPCVKAKNIWFDKYEKEKPDFSVLVTRDGKYVKNFIGKTLNNKEDVEDVYQITLLESFKSYKNFLGESCSRTWLCGVASNVLRNCTIKNSQKKVYLSDDIETLADMTDDIFESRSGPFLNPDIFYEYTELAENVSDAIEKLPGKMKEVFQAVVRDGLSYENASLRHQIPIGTVRSRVSRAREAVKAACFKS